MNEIIKSLFARKSVRAYTGKHISEEDKRLLFEAAINAPTAGNMQLYSMIDITDQAKKELCAKLCDNQPFIAEADMVVIFLADYRRWYKAFKDVDDDIRELGVGDLELAIVDAVVAAQNMVVAAESLGIGSCYIGDIIENFEEIKEVFNLPNNVAPACMLVLGYPDQKNIDRPKPVRFPLETVVYENEYHDLSEDEIYQSFKDRNPALVDPKEFALRIKNFKWPKDGFSDEMNRSMKVIIDNFTKK
ncbi:MAG: nitroreductase family protein [Erysipelotrichales bacterium]|nr:nitroreductase family protein [Erysipelotrichales bacterium]